MHSHKSFLAFILSTYQILKHDSEQVFLIPNPLNHVFGLNRVLSSLYTKCTAVLMNGFIIPGLYFQAIIKYNVTVLILVSAVTEMYLSAFKDKLMEISNHINIIHLGASVFTETQINALRDVFPKSRILQTYASTEIIGLFCEHSTYKYKPQCIGMPCPGSKISFFDLQKEHNIETNQENPGLIAISSDSKCLGYWKNPELTASITKGEYFILSDLGYKGDDGFYYFLSRADDIINSGGLKIAPLEIEEAANSFDAILESACVAVNDTIMGEVPKLYVVIKEDFTFNHMEITNYLKTKLEITRIPRIIEEIDEIPKINNKINRKELKNK